MTKKDFINKIKNINFAPIILLICALVIGSIFIFTSLNTAPNYNIFKFGKNVNDIYRNDTEFKRMDEYYYSLKDTSYITFEEETSKVIIDVNKIYKENGYLKDNDQKFQINLLYGGKIDDFNNVKEIIKPLNIKLSYSNEIYYSKDLVESFGEIVPEFSPNIIENELMYLDIIDGIYKDKEGKEEILSLSSLEYIYFGCFRLVD